MGSDLASAWAEGTGAGMALRQALPDWIARQPWYTGPIPTGIALRFETLRAGHPEWVHAIARVETGRGTCSYQLPLGVRRENCTVPAQAVIAHHVEGDVYDALHDPELVWTLVRLVDSGLSSGSLQGMPQVTGEVRSRRFPPVVHDDGTTTVIRFEGQVELRVFRLLTSGEHPGVALLRTLRTTGPRHLPPLLGTLDVVHGGRRSTLASLHRSPPHEVCGWDHAARSLVDDLRSARQDYRQHAFQLGAALARTHLDLADTLGLRIVDDAYLSDLVTSMHARLDAALAEVSSLRRFDSGLRARFDLARLGGQPLRLQKVHGDLDLGRVRRAATGWLFHGFGERLGALAQPQPTLVDIASVLLSFRHTALRLEAAGGLGGGTSPAVTQWVNAVRSAFCDGYASTSDDPRSSWSLLQALELHRAVGELHHHHRYRPGHEVLPLTAISLTVTGSVPL